MHSHPDAMLVSLQDSKARFTLPDGKTQDSVIGKETAIYTPATTHASANVGTTPVDAILVEFKAKEPGTATLPGRAPGDHDRRLLAESPRAIAFKTTAAADFHEDAGTTHDYDQVVISLGANDMSLAVEGKPIVTKWQRGTAQFIGRGVKHESKNTSGRPIEFVIVAIKVTTSRRRDEGPPSECLRGRAPLGRPNVRYRGASSAPLAPGASPPPHERHLRRHQRHEQHVRVERQIGDLQHRPADQRRRRSAARRGRAVGLRARRAPSSSRARCARCRRRSGCRRCRTGGRRATRLFVRPVIACLLAV